MKNLALLVLFFIMHSFFSCKTTNSNCITNYYFFGVKKSEGCYNGSLEDGVWKYYYWDGKIHSIEHYIKGVKNGRSIEYNEYGKITSDANFKNGNFYGIVKFYYPTGQLNTQEYYNEKGLNQGMFKLWYSSGRLSQAGEFMNGKMIGAWSQYYENGQVRYTSFYDSAGKKDDLWSFYSISGHLIKKQRYKADSLLQTLSYSK